MHSFFVTLLAQARRASTMARDKMNQYRVWIVAAVLLITAVTVVVNVVLSTPEEVVEEAPLAVPVRVYRPGEAPRMEFQAIVREKGVITIVAQTTGVVQSLPAEVGDAVTPGTVLAHLSTAYNGTSPASIQRQLAQRQLQFSTDTLEAELDALRIQRQLADDSTANAEQLRIIASNSATRTQSLISLNDAILATINDQVDAATTSAELLAARQVKSQYQSVNLQLQNALDSLRYQADDTEPQARLNQLQSDLSVRQLEIQEQAVRLSHDVSQLNLKLARAQEALLYPTAPFAGEVQRVHVRVGQAVTPGTPLVTLDCDQLEIELEVLLPQEVAGRVTRLEPVMVSLRTQTITVLPSFISDEATHGSQYSMLIPLDQAYTDLVTDGAYVSVSVPVGLASDASAINQLPLSAVYQTESSASIFVIGDDQRVVEVPVELGTVSGGYVAIRSALDSERAIILDRFVSAGQVVTPIN